MHMHICLQVSLDVFTALEPEVYEAAEQHWAATSKDILGAESSEEEEGAGGDGEGSGGTQRMHTGSCVCGGTWRYPPQWDACEDCWFVVRPSVVQCIFHAQHACHVFLLVTVPS